MYVRTYVDNNILRRLMAMRMRDGTGNIVEEHTHKQVDERTKGLITGQGTDDPRMGPEMDRNMTPITGDSGEGRRVFKLMDTGGRAY